MFNSYVTVITNVYQRLMFPIRIWVDNASLDLLFCAAPGAPTRVVAGIWKRSVPAGDETGLDLKS